MASLSTTARWQVQAKPSAKPSSKAAPTDGNPDYPTFSMDGLGASRSVKIVVYTAAGIIGTLETYAWGMWGWYKLYPPSEEERRDVSAAVP
ncbi:MAG: hypothetical protein M1817_002254 [Caeruleum heppii]|nr:MAG: hypothetical protein M1817_002254 [Caeruleum heppii]